MDSPGLSSLCVLSTVTQLQGFRPELLPVIVFEVVDTLPFDGLLQDLWLAATELLPHLHQPGSGAKNKLTLSTWFISVLKGEIVEIQMPYLRCDNISTHFSQTKIMKKNFHLLCHFKQCFFVCLVFFGIAAKKGANPKCSGKQRDCISTQSNEKEKKGRQQQSWRSAGGEDDESDTPACTCWWHPAPRWNHHIWNSTCPFPGCRPSLSTGRPAERRRAVMLPGESTIVLKRWKENANSFEVLIAILTCQILVRPCSSFFFT